MIRRNLIDPLIDSKTNSRTSGAKARAGVERRDFLKVSVAASGGLLIGFHFPGISALASAQPASADAFTLRL